MTAGCGGGGGGNTPPPPQPTTAVVKIYTTAIDPATSIGAADVTLRLPAGVTIDAVQHPVNNLILVADVGVVVPSGSATGSSADEIVYSPTTAEVFVKVISVNGFSVGEFVTVNCKVATGSFPKESDFSVADPAARDLLGADIVGAGATLTAVIQ